MKNFLCFFIIFLCIISLFYFINRNRELMETIDILNTKLEEKQLEIEQYINTINEQNKSFKSCYDSGIIVLELQHNVPPFIVCSGVQL